MTFKASEQLHDTKFTKVELGERATFDECVALCNDEAAKHGLTLDWSGDGGTTSDGRRFWLRAITPIWHFLIEEID